MDANELFMDTLDDLRARSSLRGREYDTVQAAGLTRRLLVDELPLWTVPNREKRLKLVASWGRLRVSHAVDEVYARAWIPGLWLDPEILAMGGPSGTQQVEPWSGPISKFLAHEVVIEAKRTTEQAGATISVKDVIKHFANREGGVHYDRGSSEDPFFAALHRSNERLLQLTMIAIARITIRALEPLAFSIVLDGTRWPDGLKISNDVSTSELPRSSPSAYARSVVSPIEH